MSTEELDVASRLTAKCPRPLYAALVLDRYTGQLRGVVPNSRTWKDLRALTTRVSAPRRTATTSMEEIEATCPPDDRTALRRVFPGAGRQTIGNAMRNACKSAGIASYSPHDLRHRYISVKIREGVPVTEIAAHVGHSRKSLTLDVYGHVLIGESKV
jgi:integrase